MSPNQIAPQVHRSHDTVLRVLQRYQTGGLAAILRKKGPGPKPTVTAAWEEELLRVIDDDPHARGAKLVLEAVAKHADKLRLVPTPAYDPTANLTERLWSAFRRTVTHNHHRNNVVDLFRDAFHYFEDLDACPERALRHIASPFAFNEDAVCPSPQSRAR